MDIFRLLTRIGVVLCLIVVIMGAWVRLTDAGLGCPDWPGCYGQMVVPQQPAADAFPDKPLESGKAWREMIHRYAAGTLGLVVLALAAIAVARRRRPGQPVALPLVLLGIVLFQALLGMWTVTLLLKPLVVTAHLLGGMTTLAILFWLARQPANTAAASVDPGMKRFAMIGLVVLALQIFLGAWVSTNYAGLSCPDFPTCQNRFWPPMDFVTAFDPWHGLGINYEGGVLSNAARVAIHVTHRLGAVVTVIVLLWLAIRASRNDALGTAGGMVMGAVLLQFILGIIMVATHLPVPLAVAHNAVAALLLLAVVNLNKVVRVAN